MMMRIEIDLPRQRYTSDKILFRDERKQIEDTTLVRFSCPTCCDDPTVKSDISMSVSARSKSDQWEIIPDTIFLFVFSRVCLS